MQFGAGEGAPYLLCPPPAGMPHGVRGPHPSLERPQAFNTWGGHRAASGQASTGRVGRGAAGAAWGGGGEGKQPRTPQQWGGLSPVKTAVTDR